MALSWIALVLGSTYVQLWHVLLGGSWERPPLHGDRSLPYLGAALVGAARAIGGAGALLASAIILGFGVGRAAGWRYASWREGVPAAAALGIGLLAYASLGLALAGLYREDVLRWLAAGPLVAGLGYWLAARRRADLGAVRKEGSAGPRARGGFRPRSRGGWLWGGCAAAATAMAFIAALAPESEYDAVWFHLYFPRLYLEAGRLVDLPTEYVSLYPMTWELWFGFGLALGGQTAATLLHLACLPLTALVVFEATRRYIPHASPWLAVALFATAPTVLWEASTAYTDLALGLHVTLLLYALLRYVEGRERQWLLVGALNLGLALATKHLALIVFPLACAGLALGVWLREKEAARALRAALILCALSLSLALPWYLRSWVATGNPVFPELYGLFGAPLERWDAAAAESLERFFAHFGRPRTLVNQLTLPWDMTVHAARYDGSLGPLFLALLPVLAAGGCSRALRWIAAFTAGYVLLWASPLASFQMRWLIPIVPLLAVLGAAAFGRLRALVRLQCGRGGVRVLAGVTALFLGLNLPPFTLLQERDRAGWAGWINSTLHGLPLGVVTGAESRESYLERRVSTYAAWRFANRTLPGDARVLAWSGGDNFYSRRERIWAFAVAVRKVAWAPAGEHAEALRGLRELGVTHLLLDHNFLAKNGFPAAATWDDYALTGSLARSRWYDVVYEDARATLYRVRWESLGPRGE